MYVYIYVYIARQLDQEGALKLAICNDIGEASYDRVVVAAAMCDRLIKLSKSQKGYVDMRRIVDRFMYVYTYIYKHIYIYLYTYIYIFIVYSTCLCIHVSTHIYISSYT
jgi:hypothetical protein